MIADLTERQSAMIIVILSRRDVYRLIGLYVPSHMR